MLRRQDVAEVLVLIVGFRNAADIANCLAALSASNTSPGFDVFICENGGVDAYRRLLATVADSLCYESENSRFCGAMDSSRFLSIASFKLSNRPTNVWIGCAAENLGYAGGINAWLRQLLPISGWKGIWVLNPDAEPMPNALTALVNRAELGRKGMVGSTILEAGCDNIIRFRGGMHWQRFGARSVALGLGDHIQADCNLSEVERQMDSPSGASMYVTRDCIEHIGLMDERYFLFYEDLDWGLRAKPLGLGYADMSIVAHQRGSTTGSARGWKSTPKLTVYLLHRNGIIFVRRHFLWALPLRVAFSVLQSLRFLLHGAPRNSLAVLEGAWAGLMGCVGRPAWHRNATIPFDFRT